jgi:hypothetical protein
MIVYSKIKIGLLPQFYQDWYEKHLKEINDFIKAYRKISKKMAKKAYRKINKEKIASYNKVYREKNIKILRQKKKIYREKHKEEIAEYQALYRQKIRRFVKVKPRKEIVR